MPHRIVHDNIVIIFNMMKKNDEKRSNEQQTTVICKGHFRSMIRNETGCNLQRNYDDDHVHCNDTLAYPNTSVLIHCIRIGKGS